MKLKYIKAENIFSLGKVEIDLENRGLVLITGYSEDEGSSNGAGKSSVSTKAISWALFGQIPGDIRSEEVVNRHGKDKGHAEIGFVDNDGNDCKIIRKRGKTSSLKFFVEDADVSARLAKDTQESINRAIGRDFNAFIETDYFGQSKELGYASLTSKQQKEVLEQILPIELCDEWADFAKSQYKRVEELGDEKNQAIHNAVLKKTVLDSQLKENETASSEWETDRVNKISHNKKAKQEVEKESKSILDNIQYWEKELEGIEPLDHVERLEYLYDKEQTIQNFKNLDKDLTNIINTEKFLREKKAECAMGIIQLNPHDVKGLCPACDQALPEDRLEKISQIRKRNDTLEIEHLELKRNIELCVQKSKDVQNAIAKEKEKISACSSAIAVDDAKLEEINRIKTEISRLVSDDNVRKIDKYTNTIEQLEAMENPFKSSILQLKDNVSLLDQDINKLKQKAKALNEIANDYLYWVNVYGKDLKLKLFGAACPFLDTRTAYYLGALSNDQIHVEFSTVKMLASGEAKEEFSVRCWSDTGGKSYGALSGGEKKMVSFAIGLALSDLASTQTNGSTDFLILDEPFEQLDDRNSEMMVNYLNDTCQKATILLVSNDDYLKQLVPNRIHVVKKEGITNVEN